MILRTKRITKQAALAEINLIVISTKQIHMLAKGEERRAQKSNAEKNQSLSSPKGKKMQQNHQKGSEEGKEKFLSHRNPYKNKKPVNNKNINLANNFKINPLLKIIKWTRKSMKRLRLMNSQDYKFKNKMMKRKRAVLRKVKTTHNPKYVHLSRSSQAMFQSKKLCQNEQFHDHQHQQSYICCQEYMKIGQYKLSMNTLCFSFINCYIYQLKEYFFYCFVTILSILQRQLLIIEDLIKKIAIMDQQPTPKRQSTFPLFSKHFNTHPQDVIEYFQTMRRQMQDFIDAFKKRIDVQLTYSKNLQQVSKSLDKYIKPGTELSTSYICSAFKVEHEQRSRQAQQLAESLKTEIESMCQQYLKNETATLKKMQKDIKKFYKQAQNYTENHISALQTYQGINRDMQETIITKNIMRYTTGIPQQKKVKLIGKASESIKENKEYEKLYLNSVRQYNAFVGFYNKQYYRLLREVTLQLNQAETLLRDQIVLQGDCLRKLIVAEVSMFKNIEYDLLNISKQMEYLDTQKDIEVFVQEQKNSGTNKLIPDYKREKEEELRKASYSGDSPSLPPSVFLQQKPILGKSMLSESIFYIQEQYFSWMLSNKRNKKLRQLVGKVWRILKNDQAQKQQVKEPPQVIAQNQIQQQKQQQEVQKKVQLQPQQVHPQKQQNPTIPKQQLQKQKQQQSWQTELRETISTFKILPAPNFLHNNNQKKEKLPNHEKIYQNFMQITSTIALLWNSEQIQQQALNGKLLSLQTYLAQHHLYRLLALIFIEEYRIQHQVAIKSPNNAKVCAKIVRSVIKESQKKNDVFIVRALLGLAFTFYWVDEKVKKLIYLMPQIYHCQIWKKTDFWQAAIFETTFEEMSLFTIQKGETLPQTMLRQKNIIFSQLASYCHYMVMLGITSKSVRLTVGRYCRLYDMSDEQNRDLSKMINNTLKQYKEIAPLLGKPAQRQKSVIGD